MNLISYWVKEDLDKKVVWNLRNAKNQKGGLAYLAQTAQNERYVVRACSLPLDSYSVLKKEDKMIHLFNKTLLSREQASKRDNMP